jgi:adenylate cyclase
MPSGSRAAKGARVANLRDLIRLESAPAFRVPRWADRLISAGIVSGDPDLVRRQKVANLVAYASAINAANRAVSYFFFEFTEFWFAFAFQLTLVVCALLTPQLHRIGKNAAAISLILWYMAGIFFTTFMFGLQTQSHAFFVLSGVMIFLFGVENWRLFLFCIAAIVVEMIVVLNYAPEQGVVTDERLLHSMGMQSMLTAVTINAVVVFYALYTLRRTELELRRERARADAMVATVLPDSISARLRAQPERRIADRIDQASILFADLEGFTTAAHGEPAETVVAYLDDLVRAFDQLLETHGVEKIKTIGDAYMAAGGLRGEGAVGAVAMGNLALAMLAFQEARAPLGSRRLRLRIGIHTGPAIAGVIGDTRVAYDIWGDAVNTASRMESHGIAGRIHVSDAFRRAAGDAFEFEDRGEIDVRGLGRVRTHFLLRAR